jgi:hypothetical protein
MTNRKKLLWILAAFLALTVFGYLLFRDIAVIIAAVTSCLPLRPVLPLATISILVYT